MNINQKAQELAKLIKTTDEFQTMNKYKREIEKNKNIKRQLDNYLSKKDKIYTRYKIDEANKIVKINIKIINININLNDIKVSNNILNFSIIDKYFISSPLSFLVILILLYI